MLLRQFVIVLLLFCRNSISQN